MEQAYVLVEPWVLKYWNCLFSVSCYSGLAHVFDVEAKQSVNMRAFVVLAVTCAVFLRLVLRIYHPSPIPLSVHAYSFQPVGTTYLLLSRWKNVM